MQSGNDDAACADFVQIIHQLVDLGLGNHDSHGVPLFVVQRGDRRAFKARGHGHGGGDLCLARDFVNAVGNNDPGRLTSSIDVSTESHVMGFCAEDSRLGGKKVSVS